MLRTLADFWTSRGGMSRVNVNARQDIDGNFVGGEHDAVTARSADRLDPAVMLLITQPWRLAT